MQANPTENLWDEIREKIFKSYALKSMDAVRAKLEHAIPYLERNPKLVRFITYQIVKRPLAGTAEPPKPKWDLAKALDAAEAKKAKAEASFKNPAIQSSAEPAAAIEPAAVQPASADAVADPAQSEAEARAVAAAGAAFFAPATIAEPTEEEEVLILDPAAPLDNAKKLISLRGWHKGDRMPTLRYWQRSFWDWSGANWREVDPDTTRAAMWRHLDAAEKYVKGGKKARFEPKSADVNATTDALGGSELRCLDGSAPADPQGTCASLSLARMACSTSAAACCCRIRRSSGAPTCSPIAMRRRRKRRGSSGSSRKSSPPIPKRSNACWKCSG
jgi:hypothetical protein